MTLPTTPAHGPPAPLENATALTRRDVTRRAFLRRLAGGMALALSSSAAGALAAACSSAQPAPAGEPAVQSAPGADAAKAAAKGQVIRIGFIPLTDCGSVAMAHELGLYAKHGVNVEVVREASWANVRDKLLSGDLEGAHCLFGMPFSVYTGVGGNAGREMFVGLVLNTNGQAITLSKDLFRPAIGHGIAEAKKVGPAAAEIRRGGRELTFAMTFPGGTHDMWLRYWLAAAGVSQESVKIITIPPPQMVANMKVGNMDGYCVGEPWPGVAVKEDIGFTQVATQDIWKHHREKALVLNKAFAEARTSDLKAVMRAILEASAWLDVPENRVKAAPILGGQAYVNAPPDVIDARLAGKYDLGAGLGERVYTDDTMLYGKNGTVNFPRKGHGIWFMAQYIRFGYLKQPPEYAAIAKTLILQDVYRDVAKDMSLPIPDDDMAPITPQIDGITFDPNDPGGSLARYPVVPA